MNNMKKIILGNQNGMNLLSVIGTVAVLGVGVVAALKLTKMSDLGQDSASRKVEASSLTSIVETKLKSAFLNTKDANGKLTSGLCSIIKVASLDTQLSNVYLQLPSTKNNSLFSKGIWGQSFAGLVEIPEGKGCKIQNSYGKCFKFDSKADIGAGVSKGLLSKLDPVFEINIKPVQTNPAADLTFSPLEPDGSVKYDLKAVGFEYTIRATYNASSADEESKLGRRYTQGFIWAGDAGICEVGNKKISLTANSFGDPDDKIIFNQAGFSSDSTSRSVAPPLEVTLLNSQIRSGVIGGTLGSQFLVSRDQASAQDNDTGPVYSACNEDQFRCPQLNHKDRTYQFMRHMIRARYQVPNRLTNTGNNVQISPSIKFKNLNEKVLMASYAESFNVGGNTYTKDKDGWYYADINNTKVPLRISGEESVIARLSDLTGSPQSNDVCRQICVPETNYNSNPTNHFTSHFNYRVNASIPAGQSDSFEVASGPVACTSCYMKNCDQFGLGTFGAMHIQPTEPLDAGVPECVRHESHVDNVYETAEFDMGPANANRCIAGRLNYDDNSGYKLSAVSCESELPVMCFAFGKHMLARNITLSSSSVLKTSFKNASNVCFELGKENIKKEPFRTLLSQQGNLGAVEQELLGITDPNQQINENQRMEVMNFVGQGSFFAPVGLNQEVSLRSFADIQGEKPQLINNDSWFGLKTDGLGYVYAPAPRLASTALDPKSKWGIHYDGNGRMVVKKTSDQLGIRTSAESGDDEIGSKVGLLFHGPRFKGVHFVRSIKPFERAGGDDLRALCRRKSFPYSLFVSKSRASSFKKAETLCLDENGVFLPPLTTAGWATAYQLVQPNHPKHPFPAIWESKDLDPVWVNIVEAGGTDSLYMNNILSGTVSKFMNSKGEFVAETYKGKSTISDQEKDNHDYACFDKKKGEISFRHICTHGSRPLSQDELMAATRNDNIYIRFMLKAALASRSGHGLIKLYQ